MGCFSSDPPPTESSGSIPRSGRYGVDGVQLMRHGRVASFPDLDVASGGERDRL
jgi:hypothetical protein